MLGFSKLRAVSRIGGTFLPRQKIMKSGVRKPRLSEWN